jgi:hypothetical protein
MVYITEASKNTEMTADLSAHFWIHFWLTVQMGKKNHLYSANVTGNTQMMSNGNHRSYVQKEA